MHGVVLPQPVAVEQAVRPVQDEILADQEERSSAPPSGSAASGPWPFS